MLLLALGVLAASPLLLALSFVLAALYRRVLAALRLDAYAHLPQPSHADGWLRSLVFGDLGAVQRAPPAEQHLAWGRELGNVFVYRSMFYTPRLWLGDAGALNHILGAANSYAYPKPGDVRRFLKNLLGEGVLVAEGDVHRRQRRIIQPAFNLSSIRDLTPVFFKHANRTAAILARLTAETREAQATPFVPGQSAVSAQKCAKGSLVIDVSAWLSKTTLDIIGEAGFGFDFKAIDEFEGIAKGDDVAAAFNTMMSATVDIGLVQILQFYLQTLPGMAWVRDLPTQRQRLMRATYAVLERSSQRIISEKREAIAAELREAAGESEKQASGKTFTKGAFEDARSSSGRDLLHLMLRSNMASDIKDSERLSDAELLGQLTTLILAGHETTQTQLSWCLWVLSSRPAMQQRLRDELVEHFAGRDELDFDALNNLEYLDYVTKEIMRYISPVVATRRTLVKDDVVPLSKPYPRSDGKGSFSYVELKKGQDVFIPIQYMNRSKELWGPTADEFDPERWRNVPEQAKAAGFPLHLLTFIEGPRGCVGNRFAITEFKALLASLLLKLRFESIEGWQVEPKQGVVVRARIKGQEEIGMQMPLRLTCV